MNVKPRLRRTYFFNLDLTATWRDFSLERTGVDLGNEIDLQATAAITPHLTMLAKYADFDSPAPIPAGGAADCTKTWFGFEYKY